MDGFERIYRVHRALRARRHAVSTTDLMGELECSRATFHRTIAHMRDVFNAPIINAPYRGYLYDRSQPEFELPGIWFSAEELEALLVMDDVMSRLQPGLLAEHLRPVRKRIQEMLDKGTHGRRRFPSERIRLVPTHTRRLKSGMLGRVCTAIVARHQLSLRYRGRVKNTVSERRVSPQRIVYYRDNWYLDAYCHQTNALRTFSIDRIEHIRVEDKSPIDLPEDDLDRQLTGSYGIFSGTPRFRARLLFTPERARWVADELWHPDQHGQFRTDGSYELSVPYRDPRELLGEILRHGGAVKVLGPKRLVSMVHEAGKALVANHAGDVDT